MHFLTAHSIKIFKLPLILFLMQNSLLEVGPEVHDWMQGSIGVKNGQIDPKASKGVMNVLLTLSEPKRINNTKG